MVRSVTSQFPGWVCVHLLYWWAVAAKANAVPHELDVPRRHPPLQDWEQEVAEAVAVILAASWHGAARQSLAAIRLLDGKAEPASMPLKASWCAVLPQRTVPPSTSYTGWLMQRMGTLPSTF